MQMHFEAFAKSVMADILAGRADPFVVELGSNDGIMLRHFHERGIRHLGVEPSVNVADVARSRGINTISAFFNRKLAEDIVAEHGRADVMLAANVMCHIPDLPGVAAGVQHLLKPDGVFIFEDPYLGDMIAKTSYDQIYDEHVFIFSATSIARAFASAWTRARRRRAADHAWRFDALHAGAEGKPAGYARALREQLAKEQRAGARPGRRPICSSSRIARTRASRLMQTLDELRARRASAWSATARRRRARQ